MLYELFDFAYFNILFFLFSFLLQAPAERKLISELRFISSQTPPDTIETPLELPVSDPRISSLILPTIGGLFNQSLDLAHAHLFPSRLTHFACQQPQQRRARRKIILFALKMSYMLKI